MLSLLAVTAGLLIVIIYLHFFFDLTDYSRSIVSRLEEDLHIRISFQQVGIRLLPTPGLSIEHPIIALDDQGQEQTLLSARRILLKPMLISIRDRLLRCRIVLSEPALNIERAPDGQWNIHRLIKTRTPLEEEQEQILPHADLGDLLHLPLGLELESLDFTIKKAKALFRDADGEMDRWRIEISKLGIQGNIQQDLGTAVAIDSGDLVVRKNGPDSFHLRSLLSGTLSLGKMIQSISFEGKVDLDAFEIKAGEAHVPIAHKISIDLQGEKKESSIVVPELLLATQGINCRLNGAITTKGDLEISLSQAEIDVERLEDFQSFLSFLQEWDIGGSMTFQAEHVRIHPSQDHSDQEGLLTRWIPSWLSVKQASMVIRDASISNTESGHADLTLKGMNAEITFNEERGLNGEIKTSNTLCALSDQNNNPDDNEPSSRTAVSGPTFIKFKLSEQPDGVNSLVVVDLTDSEVVWSNFLRKPKETPCLLGFRAMGDPEKIHVGRLYLQLDQTEFNMSGEICTLDDPYVRLKAHSNLFSMDSLSSVSPFVREHAISGMVEIRDIRVQGRIRQWQEQMALKGLLAAESLMYNDRQLKAITLDFDYANRVLTLNQAFIRLPQGKLEAIFSVDFSGDYLQRGESQYYGTVKIKEAELNDLLLLCLKDIQDPYYGNVDAHFVFQGTDFTLESLKREIEGKGKIYISNIVLPENNEASGGIIAPIKKLFNEFSGEDDERAKESMSTERMKLLSQNQLSAIATLSDGKVQTRSLVACYDGKLIQIKGGMSLDGVVQVSEGELYLGRRMIPFRIDCHIGQDKCTPKPHYKRIVKNSGKEIGQRLNSLSHQSRNVFTDVFN
ncbi:hypothetical protein ACFL4G_04180 [Thermodesulfobacteriota bacterium]